MLAVRESCLDNLACWQKSITDDPNNYFLIEQAQVKEQGQGVSLYMQVMDYFINIVIWQLDDNLYNQRQQKMGNNQSEEIHPTKAYIQTYYNPISYPEQVAGNPLLLQFSSRVSTNNRIPPQILKYNLFMDQSWDHIERQKEIYRLRSRRSVYFVNLFYYEIQERQKFQCCQNNRRATIYTQHVDHRLTDFSTKKTHPNKRSQQIFASLSFNQSIYLLITTLHAFQQLSEYTKLPHPTDSMIGINKKGQVKIWLNQNWADNRVKHQCEKQEWFVEELVKNIQQRMQNCLNIDYEGKKFQEMQEKLSQYVVNYHQGKKQIQRKINNPQKSPQNGQSHKFKQQDRKIISQAKTLINNNHKKPTQRDHFIMQQLKIDEKNRKKVDKKIAPKQSPMLNIRYFSHNDNRRENEYNQQKQMNSRQKHPIVKTAIRNDSNQKSNQRPRTPNQHPHPVRIYQSPQKSIVHFNYSNPQTPCRSSHTEQNMITNINIVSPHSSSFHQTPQIKKYDHKPQNVRLASKNHNLSFSPADTANSLKNLSHQLQIFDKNLMVIRSQQKGIKNSRKDPSSINNFNANKKKVQTNPILVTSQTFQTKLPFKELYKTDKKQPKQVIIQQLQNATSLEYKQQNNKAIVVDNNLKEITEQFRILLQSSSKIKQPSSPQNIVVKQDQKQIRKTSLFDANIVEIREEEEESRVCYIDEQ